MSKSARNVEEMVISTISRICKRQPSEITPLTTLRSLGVDSLAVPAIVARLEALFECEFDHEQTLDFLQAVRVDDIAALVRSKIERVSPTLA